MNHPSTYHLIVGTNQLLDLLFLSNPVISNSFTLHIYLLHYYLAMMPFLTKGKIGGGGAYLPRRNNNRPPQSPSHCLPPAADRGPCGIMAMRLRRTFHPPPTPRAATRDTAIIREGEAAALLGEGEAGVSRVPGEELHSGGAQTTISRGWGSQLPRRGRGGSAGVPGEGARRHCCCGHCRRCCRGVVFGLDSGTTTMTATRGRQCYYRHLSTILRH